MNNKYYETRWLVLKEKVSYNKKAVSWTSVIDRIVMG